MNFQPPFFLMNPQAHFMTPGVVAFIPGWIWLFIIILVIIMSYPKFFQQKLDHPNNTLIINPLLLAFIIGSLVPVFDDIFPFLFGPPFAHHSLFHSFLGSSLTYIMFRIISTRQIAKFAFFGNLFHIIYNYYFDYVTIFFPFTYQEFGLTDLIKVNTYWIKAISYPIILVTFFLAALNFFTQQKK